MLGPRPCYHPRVVGAVTAFKGCVENESGEQIVYPLLPWKWLVSLVTGLVMLAVYADDVGRWLGAPVTDSLVVRYLPLAVVTILVGVFAPTGWWAPWRILWRIVPPLNRWVFPDLNGIWDGSTKSNWPVIEKMLESAQAYRGIDREELLNLPHREDALAVQIKASLFSLKICAALSSTEGQSYSITARPRREENSGHIHITYVYAQNTPDPSCTDQDNHMGSADVELDPDTLKSVEGVYWTRRMWKQGLNTAGRINLRKLSDWKDPAKSLKQYAAEAKAKVSKAPE